MKVIQNLRHELKKNSSEAHKISSQNFHKQPIKCYGTPTPIVRKIAREQYNNIKHLTKTDVFDLCEQLMRSGMQEEFTIASAWAFKRRKEFTTSDFKIFEAWVNKYILNWGSCDDFCSKSLGHLLLDFPALIPKTKPWTKSKNQWLRRASAVSLIIPVRRKKNLDDIFDVSLKLINDPEDLVQKAYGWALKEASNIYPKQVFEFVIKHKAQMSRTALRYAVEKLPQKQRKIAMG